MRTMIRVHFPVARGNQANKDGSLPKALESFLAQFKPETAYFFPDQGKRAALFVIDLPDPSTIVRVAEHFFQAIDAEVQMTPVMTIEDLRSGLAEVREPAHATV